MYSSVKLFFELLYWKLKKRNEGKFSNSHYRFFYTEYFSISDSYYQNKRILDIGCGPRGSLEWAYMAKKRVGIDPLADQYKKLGADQHKMTMIKANAEKIPFRDEYFDIVCSFNSIDHVDDLRKSCNEITRVLKKDGLFLLIVDIHSMPRPMEPQKIYWDFTDKYFPDFEVIQKKQLKSVSHNRIYENVRHNVPFEGSKKQKGVLTAKLKKLS